MRPNLFDYATSELSQDAMLCWLAAWGNPRVAQEEGLLHGLGRAFLQAVFAKHDRKMPDIDSLRIKRQYRSIDVLVVINDAIAVCIEDKLQTREHSEQLRRYLASLKEEGFSDDHIVPVYVQTGEQGSYREAEAAGYAVMRRRELAALLRKYLEQGGSDSIARDFHDHLVNIESRVEAFRETSFAEWDSYAWQGFYSELQRKLADGEWAYVANPSGGFWGYWWHSYAAPESDQYLQIEEHKLCFKISVKKGAKASELRSHWLKRILTGARHRNFPVVRPERLGSGGTMTVAVFQGEYRAVNSHGALDLDATVSLLRAATEVLDLAVRVEPSEE